MITKSKPKIILEIFFKINLHINFKHITFVPAKATKPKRKILTDYENYINNRTKSF